MPKVPAKKRRKVGRPPKQDKTTDAKVLAVLGCGGTFIEAAQAIGLDHSAIFHRMNENAALKELVMKARAIGLQFRKAMLEDVLFVAAMRIIDDPRYSAMAIFTAKAMLQWTDLPTNLDNGCTSIREVLAEVVRRKRIALGHAENSGVLDFLPATATVK